jgi:hypothetical protein
MIPGNRPITARVEAHGRYEHRRKVIWRRENGLDLSWHAVDMEGESGLKGLAAVVRARLGELRDAAMRGEVAQSGRLLKAIAEAGRELYVSFFTDADQINTELVKKTRAWLGTKAGAPMTFFLDPRVYIPWGLLYDGDPARLPDDPTATDIGLYGDFWCLKYGIAAVYDVPGAFADAEGIAHEQFRILAAFDHAVREAAAKRLPPTDRALHDHLFPDARSVYSRDDLLKRWDELADRHGLLLFLCHANETSLALKGLDAAHRVSVKDFKTRLRRKDDRDRDTACLVFLNGCNTAVGASDGAFLEATGGQGFFGFIGTETEVPDVFALRMSLAFTRRLLHSGQAAYAIMDDLRRQHWPLGLLYSTYCNPDVSVTPGGAPCPPESAENFSHGPLGTNR